MKRSITHHRSGREALRSIPTTSSTRLASGITVTSTVPDTPITSRFEPIMFIRLWGALELQGSPTFATPVDRCCFDSEYDHWFISNGWRHIGGSRYWRGHAPNKRTSSAGETNRHSDGEFGRISEQSRSITWQGDHWTGNKLFYGFCYVMGKPAYRSATAYLMLF